MKSNTGVALDAEELGQLLGSPPLRRIRGRNRTKADILIYRRGDSVVAIKDYSPRPFLVRHTLGRCLVRRETSAYRALRDVEGLPRFLGRLGGLALATEWIEGRPLSELERDAVPRGCFDRLEAIVAGLHGRGVALGDLHHRDVLVGAEGSVHLVDLATALVLGPRPGPLRRRLFARLRDQDRVALARLRARFTGGDEEAAVHAIGGAAAAWHRRGRRAKRWLRRLRGRR